jgi:hypothetical protein
MVYIGFSLKLCFEVHRGIGFSLKLCFEVQHGRLLTQIVFWGSSWYVSHSNCVLRFNMVGFSLKLCFRRVLNDL